MGQRLRVPAIAGSEYEQSQAEYRCRIRDRNQAGYDAGRQRRPKHLRPRAGLCEESRAGPCLTANSNLKIVCRCLYLAYIL